MKITVKNFGPIREAKDIEISPMTLFVGPSNTGKSYLAVLIYSIFNVLNAPLRRRFWRDEATLQEKKRQDNNVKKFLDTLSKKNSISAETQKIAEDLTESIFFVWVGYIKKSLENQIPYCFGEEGNNLLKNKKMSVVLSPNNDEIFIDIMSPSESKISNKAKKIIGDRLVKLTQQVLEEMDQEYHYHRMNFIILCAKQFAPYLWETNPEEMNPKETNLNMSDCHYLPAIRGGIMQSHRALVDTLIKQAPMAGLREISPPPMFTGVLADFMRKLIHISGQGPIQFYIRRRGSESKKKIVSIGKSMETDIMQGEIEVRETEMGYPDFYYKFESNKKLHDLSLMNTSSMVSELAPVSLFIRYYLNKRDFFIVEEPEAHLHPEGQRKIADVLVQLANAGVFVLATTHSDIILEQISNSVLASKLEPAKLKALSKHPTPLKESDSASYSFAERVKESTVVKKIIFDSMTGVITQDHLNVSSDIYNESVSLLEGQEDD